MRQFLTKKQWRKVQGGRKPMHRGAKKRALKRDKYTCQRCGIKLFDKDSKRTRDKRKAVLHHIVPVSEGGQGSFRNLLSTCRPCEDEHHGMEVGE